MNVQDLPRRINANDELVVCFDVSKEKLDGEQEAELIRLACSEAPEGRSQWSLRLLADKMVELGVVEDLSQNGPTDA